MCEFFKAKKVTEKVYWVGAIDWQIRDFHGYATKRGTSYNAYLVLADKITLIDTVKAPFKDELMSRIASVIDPSEIDYIVSNHSEMDHSGCLSEVIDEIKPEKVFVSKMGEVALLDHFHSKIEGKITSVEDGQDLMLGNMKLKFMETRMLHWPDSMVSYLEGESLLFSQDAFGMHLASTERFDDEIDDSILEYEAEKYYANILLPYSPLITKLVDKLTKSGLDIKIVAPDHGPIWRKNLQKIVGLYSGWALQRPENRAIIVYDTMWHSTELMARAISEGLTSGGTENKIISMRVNHRSDVATELMGAGAIILGSPTLNNNIFPTMADALTYISGLKPKNKIGAAFGSYGWSGEGVRHLNEFLKKMKIDLVSDGISVKYVPDEKVLSECRSLGKDISDKLKEITGK